MSKKANPGAPPAAFVRAALFVSRQLLAFERAVIVLLMSLLTGLILLNVTTRYAGFPVYWVDEAAVYTCVWLTFIGASAMTRLRYDFTASLITGHLRPALAKLAQIVATLAVVIFGMALAYMCWLWMDPVGIASAGFDARSFSDATFNFLYTERTQTLDWPTWVVNLIIPIFAVSITIHGLANLLEDLGLSPRIAGNGLGATSMGAVN